MDLTWTEPTHPGWYRICWQTSPSEREAARLPASGSPSLGEWVSEWPTGLHPLNSRAFVYWNGILVMFIIIECALLRSDAQVPGSVCITYGLVVIVHRPDIRISESLSLSEAEAVLRCLPSRGQSALEQPLTPCQQTCTQGWTSVRPGTTIEGINPMPWLT